MPKHDPLPPPPNVPDQLSDADEMERVLEEHLLKPVVPVGEPSTGDTEAPETTEPVFRDDRAALQRARLLASDAFGELWDMEVESGISSSKFFLLFKDKSDRTISMFVEKFFKIYPNSEALVRYLNDLTAMPILKPASDQKEYLDKVGKIVNLIALYNDDLSEYGFEDGQYDVKSLNNVDFINRFSVDGQWLSADKNARDSIIEASEKKVGVSADRIARAMAAALTIRNKSSVSPYPKSLIDSKGDAYDDNLANYAQYTVSGIITAKVGEPDTNPFKKLVDVAKEGGIFLGFRKDSNDQENKYVFYIPYY